MTNENQEEKNRPVEEAKDNQATEGTAETQASTDTHATDKTTQDTSGKKEQPMESVIANALEEVVPEEEQAAASGDAKAVTEEPSANEQAKPAAEKPAEEAAATPADTGPSEKAAPAEAAKPADEAKATPAEAAKPADEAKAETTDDDNESEGGEESFEALLEQYDQFRNYRPGDMVEGQVVSTSDQEVLIDIGARVEGMVPASELRDEEGNLTVTDGDTVRAMVCRFTPDGQYIPLSFERARVARVWDKIEEMSNNNERIEGTVIEKVKGGFIVDVGVRAFLPTSQATLRPHRDNQDLLGEKMAFNILKIQRRRGNLILSRREILEAEHKEQREELFAKLSEGAELQGAVKNITDYGAFIDLGGLDGLLHITDMSWGRINHPKDLLEVGQELTVKVLRFDAEKEKVSLGLKQCTPDPWLSASEKYPPGTEAKGKVLNLTSYGSFVELEPGVEGMIHVSELSWTKKVRNPAQVLSKGQEVEVRVLDLDMSQRRVSLSMKQTEDNPWETLAERFPVGSRVTGKVRNITDFGAFVEIEEGIDGLVHVSDFHWGERNATPTDYVTKGEEAEVVILAVDTENRKVSLGIKQLEQDPWIEFTNNHRQGETVTAPVTRITEFGAFVKLSDHVEGLLRNAEMNHETRSGLKEGDEVKVLISRVSHRDRKVDLSERKLQQAEERRAVAEYAKKNDTGGATMGDLFSDDLKKLL